jgi:hypothetical protein
MTWEIAQRSRFVGDDWWKWSVWIEASDSRLRTVESVTYHLHPTFPNPVVVVRDRASKFRLSSGGWGEFEIKADVRLKDGSTESTRHWLGLRYPTEAKDENRARDGGAAPRKPSRRQPVVFLTGAAADGGITDSIRRELTAHRIKVCTASDLDADLPLGRALDALVKQADASIVVISNARSPWLEREMEMLNRHEVTVFPVVIGPETALPQMLEGRQVLRLDDAGDAAALARRLVGEIRSRPVVD